MDTSTITVKSNLSTQNMHINATIDRSTKNKVITADGKLVSVYCCRTCR